MGTDDDVAAGPEFEACIASDSAVAERFESEVSEEDADSGAAPDDDHERGEAPFSGPACDGTDSDELLPLCTDETGGGRLGGGGRSWRTLARDEVSSREDSGGDTDEEADGDTDEDTGVGAEISTLRSISVRLLRCVCKCKGACQVRRDV